jgi:hypothetical protein
MNLFKLIPFFILAAFSSQELKTGDTVPDIKLADVYDHQKSMPFLGSRVFLLLYIDPDRQHIIDPLTKELDTPEIDRLDFEVVSVIDCKDTWIPFWLLQTGARKEQKRHPESPILFDTDNSLQSSWKFGNCDNESVVVIVGKDSQVALFGKMGSEDECRNYVPQVLAKIREMTK